MLHPSSGFEFSCCASADNATAAALHALAASDLSSHQCAMRPTTMPGYRIGDMLLHEHQRSTGCVTPQECLQFALNTSNANVHMRTYPRSLVAAYLRSNPPSLTGGCNKAHCFAAQHGRILDGLLARYRPREQIGLAMHVRVGDVLDDSTDHSAKDFLCNRINSNAHGNDHQIRSMAKWTHYVKSLAFYTRVANEITSRAHLRRLLPLHVFYGAGPFPPGYDTGFNTAEQMTRKVREASYPRSCTYLRAIVAYLNARGVPTVEHADGGEFGPDESFAAIASSKVLVITGGGYGQLAGAMVQRRNGIVLGMSDGWDTCDFAAPCLAMQLKHNVKVLTSGWGTLPKPLQKKWVEMRCHQLVLKAMGK